MYPDNNPGPTPPPTQSVDYLNQIAPSSSGNKLFSSRKQIILFSALGGAIVLSLLIIIVASVSGNSKPTERLAAQLITADSIASDARSKIKNSQLRAVNGDLSIYLTNTIRDIDQHLLNQGVKIKDLDKKIVAEQKKDETLGLLEDARLNATYDRTYAREMAYMLETTLALMRQIHGSARNENLKNFLKTSFDNLEPIQQHFADFNATNN